MYLIQLLIVAVVVYFVSVFFVSRSNSSETKRAAFVFVFVKACNGGTWGKGETGGCGRDRLQTCQTTFPHLVGKTSEASMTFQDVHQSAP